MEPEQAAGRPRLPPETRALAAFLAFDLIGGVWLALHYQDGLGLFLTQVPVLGIAGAVWGFLPDEPKDAFGSWLAGFLRLRLVFWLMVVAATTLVVVTFFVATIRVEAVDSDVATMVYLVQGSQRDLDRGTRAVLDSSRLNRLRTPIHFALRIVPPPRRVWLYTSTHVSGEDVEVWPWKPSRLEYPDGFSPMATIAALLHPASVPNLATHGEVRLVVRDLRETRDTLATATLKDMHGLLLSFTEPAPPDESLRQRWESTLNAVFREDPSNVAPTLDLWAKARWVRTGRPLVSGDSVRWEVRTTRGDSLAAGTLGLSHGVTDLVLTF